MSSPLPRVLPVVALGGALGALARYGVSVAVPHSPGSFPWSTLLVNATGCLLVGLLLGWHDRSRRHALVRPFLAVGVLGGYTTFSTYVVDVENLFAAGRFGVAAVYLMATLVVALLAVWGGLLLTRRGTVEPETGAGEPR